MHVDLLYTVRDGILCMVFLLSDEDIAYYLGWILLALNWPTIAGVGYKALYREA